MKKVFYSILLSLVCSCFYGCKTRPQSDLGLGGFILNYSFEDCYSKAKMNSADNQGPISRLKRQKDKDDLSIDIASFNYYIPNIMDLSNGGYNMEVNVYAYDDTIYQITAATHYYDYGDGLLTIYKQKYGKPSRHHFSKDGIETKDNGTKKRGYMNTFVWRYPDAEVSLSTLGDKIKTKNGAWEDSMRLYSSIYYNSITLTEKVFDRQKIIRKLQLDSLVNSIGI